MSAPYVLIGEIYAANGRYEDSKEIFLHIIRHLLEKIFFTILGQESLCEWMISMKQKRILKV